MDILVSHTSRLESVNATFCAVSIDRAEILEGNHSFQLCCRRDSKVGTEAPARDLSRELFTLENKAKIAELEKFKFSLDCCNPKGSN